MHLLAAGHAWLGKVLATSRSCFGLLAHTALCQWPTMPAA